mgnify:CR=1 FL=1
MVSGYYRNGCPNKPKYAVCSYAQNEQVVKKEDQLPKKVYITTRHRTYVSNNKYINPKEIKPEEIPVVYHGNLIVPVKQLADVYNGSYNLNLTNKTAMLKIDESVFEFTVGSNIAKVNGALVNMPCEAKLESNILRVPAEVFVENMTNYDVKLFDNSAMIMRKKSIYDNNGNYLEPKKDFKFASYIGRLYNWEWEIPYLREGRIENINRISDEIVSRIFHEGMTDYEKVLAVNKYMSENIEYDDSFEAGYWDAFLTKKANSNGFAYATGLLLEKMGVKSLYVSGYDGLAGSRDIDEYEMMNYKNNAHSWNIILLNGKYYHLDTAGNKAHGNKYLLVSDEQMINDHVWRIGSYPACESEFK